MLMAAATSPTSASPVPTLKTAPTSGISAATIEANMMSRSTSAALRPISSDTVSSGACPIWPAPPP